MRKYLILLVFSFFGLSLFAQNTVTITSTLLPPFPMNYQDLMTRQIENVISVRNNSSTFQTLQLRFRFYSDDNGVQLRTKANFKSGIPLNLAPNETKLLKGNELADLFNEDGLEISGITKEDVFAKRAVPEGLYFLCIQAFDYNTNTTLSIESCSNPIAMMSLEPPTLRISNAKKTGENIDTIINVTPQNVFFSWNTPSNLRLDALQKMDFRLKIVEIPDGFEDDGNQAMAAASANTTEYLIRGNNFFVYGPTRTPLIIGRRYAAVVKISDPNNTYTFRNEGKSEVISFVYGDPSGSTGITRRRKENPRLDYVPLSQELTGKVVWGFSQNALKNEPRKIDLLEKNASLAGKNTFVFDNSGGQASGTKYPLAGAKVVLIGRTADGKTTRIPTTTDKNGNYRFVVSGVFINTCRILYIDISYPNTAFKRTFKRVPIPRKKATYDFGSTAVVANTFNLAVKAVCPTCDENENLSYDVLIQKDYWDASPFFTQSGDFLAKDEISYNNKRYVSILNVKNGNAYKKLFQNTRNGQNYLVRLRYHDKTETTNDNDVVKIFPLESVYRPRYSISSGISIQKYYSMRLSWELNGVVTFDNAPRKGVRGVISLKKKQTYNRWYYPRPRYRYVTYRTYRFTTNDKGKYVIKDIDRLPKGTVVNVHFTDRSLQEGDWVEKVTYEGQQKITHDLELKVLQQVMVGRILDEKSGAVEHALVRFNGSSCQTFTTKNGYFILKIPAAYSSGNVTVSANDYGTQNIPIQQFSQTTMPAKATNFTIGSKSNVPFLGAGPETIVSENPWGPFMKTLVESKTFENISTFQFNSSVKDPSDLDKNVYPPTYKTYNTYEPSDLMSELRRLVGEQNTLHFRDNTNELGARKSLKDQGITSVKEQEAKTKELLNSSIGFREFYNYIFDPFESPVAIRDILSTRLKRISETIDISIYQKSTTAAAVGVNSGGFTSYNSVLNTEAFIQIVGTKEIVKINKGDYFRYKGENKGIVSFQVSPTPDGLPFIPFIADIDITFRKPGVEPRIVKLYGIKSAVVEGTVYSKTKQYDDQMEKYIDQETYYMVDSARIETVNDIYSAYTDKEGNYRLYIPFAQEYTLKVTADGYNSKTHNQYFIRDVTDVGFDLEPADDNFDITTISGFPVTIDKMVNRGNGWTVSGTLQLSDNAIFHLPENGKDAQLTFVDVYVERGEKSEKVGNTYVGNAVPTSDIIFEEAVIETRAFDRWIVEVEGRPNITLRSLMTQKNTVASGNVPRDDYSYEKGVIGGSRLMVKFSKAELPFPLSSTLMDDGEMKYDDATLDIYEKRRHQQFGGSFVQFRYVYAPDTINALNPRQRFRINLNPTGKKTKTTLSEAHQNNNAQVYNKGGSDDIIDCHVFRSFGARKFLGGIYISDTNTILDYRGMTMSGFLYAPWLKLKKFSKLKCTKTQVVNALLSLDDDDVIQGLPPGFDRMGSGDDGGEYLKPTELINDGIPLHPFQEPDYNQNIPHSPLIHGPNPGMDMFEAISTNTNTLQATNQRVCPNLNDSFEMIAMDTLRLSNKTNGIDQMSFRPRGIETQIASGKYIGIVRLSMYGLGSPNFGMGIAGAMYSKPDCNTIKDQIGLGLDVRAYGDGVSITANVFTGPDGYKVGDFRFKPPSNGKGNQFMLYGAVNSERYEFKIEGSGVMSYVGKSKSEAGTIFPIDFMLFRFRVADENRNDNKGPKPSVFVALKSNTTINLGGEGDKALVSLHISRFLLNIGEKMSLDQMNEFMTRNRTVNYVEQKEGTYTGSGDQAFDDNTNTSWAIGIEASVTVASMKGMKSGGGGVNLLLGEIDGKFDIRLNQLMLGYTSPGVSASMSCAFSFTGARKGFEGAAKVGIDGMPSQMDGWFKFYSIDNGKHVEMGFDGKQTLGPAGISVVPLLTQLYSFGFGIDFNTKVKKVKIWIQGDMGLIGTPRESMYLQDAYISFLFSASNCLGVVPVVEGGGRLNMANQDWGPSVLTVDLCKGSLYLSVNFRKTFAKIGVASVNGTVYALAPIPKITANMGSFGNVTLVPGRKGALFLGLYATVTGESGVMRDILTARALVCLGVNFSLSAGTIPSNIVTMWNQIDRDAKTNQGTIFNGVYVGVSFPGFNKNGQVSFGISGVNILQFKYHASLSGYLKIYAGNSFFIKGNVSATANASVKVLIFTLRANGSGYANIVGGHNGNWYFDATLGVKVNIKSGHSVSCNKAEFDPWRKTNECWRHWWVCGKWYRPRTCWKTTCLHTPSYGANVCQTFYIAYSAGRGKSSSPKFSLQKQPAPVFRWSFW